MPSADHVADSAIAVADLVKRYRGASRNALDGVSFAARGGSLFCLLGPNGAGKTTALAILTTTLRPTSGRVSIAGLDLDADPSGIRRRLGIVFQQTSLDANLTGEENLRLAAVTYGAVPWRPTYRMMPGSYRRQVQDLAAVVGVDDLLHQPVRTLSGGTRRKLELVRALLHRPAILFLDEPTAGLDPQVRRDLWRYLAQVRSERTMTVFLTTHYLHEAEAADHICVLREGRIVARGSPAALKARFGGNQLVIDSADRSGLLARLASLGLAASGTGPFRVTLKGRRAQEVVAGLDADLTRLELSGGTLEDAYLRLLDRPAQ
jgi:ABC-2 type transport system ATP-binding protein